VLKSTGAWLDSTQGGAAQGAGGGDNSPVSEAYAKMLRIFIPLLVDEVGCPFFTHGNAIHLHHG
jgi:hypothetical protein